MTAQPEPEAPKVVVTPIPPEQSTTLRLNKRWAIWTPIAATLLTIIDVLMQVFADPTLAPLIAKYLPMELRIGATAIVWILARQNWTKRMNTAQPIIGSPAEAKATRLVGLMLACLLTMGCATTTTRRAVAPHAAAVMHDVPWWEHPAWATLDRAFQAYANFLDRLFPDRAKPEHGGECIGIVWTGTDYRCSESGAKDAGDGQPRQPKKENE